MTSNTYRSFDVFDTAIERSVYLPSDIFKLIEEKVGNDFYTKRIEAEKEISKTIPYYTLKDIYSLLPEFSMDEELTAELENCYANKEILTEYEKDPEHSVFISDMYLPSEVIEKMLEKVGYTNPRVFVSCELKALKFSGEAFKKVMKKLKGKISIHYGDNYVADIEGARRAKVPETRFKPALHTRKLNLPVVKDTTLKKLCALIEDNASGEEQLVFYVTPLVTEFTKWVIRERKEGQKVFFLSRDMYIPYRLASEVLKEPDIYYIHASRKSLASVCLKSPDKELVERMSWILSEDELKSKEEESIEETIKYLKKVGIQDGDMIVDIGYSGTIQAGIDSALGIKTKGMYMQVSDDKLKGVDMSMFLSRSVMIFLLMVETPLGSSEDCVISYKDEQPVFIPETEARKEQAVELNNLLWEMSNQLIYKSIPLFDVEQLLIHVQYYPSESIISLLNEGIYSNRCLGESIIGFDKDEIMRGNLRSLYDKSYCKPLFKKLLEADKELAHLSKLL